MTKVINLNVSDTPISGAPTTVPCPSLNWGKDFAKKQNVAGQAVLSYNASPADAPQTVRFASTPISNIYTNTAVDPSYQLPNKRGVSLLAQLTQVVTVTDDAVPEYRVDLPFEAHVVFRTPLTSFLTEAQMFGIITRAFACLIDEQTPANPSEYRLKQLLRGVMVPDNL